MAEQIFTDIELSAYPGVNLDGVTAGTIQLVVMMANGMVTDIIGELTPVPVRAKAIALEVAARSLRNPEGASSVSKKIDDWTKTIRWEGEGAEEAGVFLTDAEEAELRRMLAAANRSTRRRSRSISMHVPGYGYGSQRY